MDIRSILRAAAVAALVATIGTAGSAQLGGLGKQLGRVPGVPSASSLLRGDPPISTGLRDARWGDPPRTASRRASRLAALTTLQRTPAGGFVLQAGYYVMQSQSYCLHAGTHGPGGGDGYLYAPTKGSAEDA